MRQGAVDIGGLEEPLAHRLAHGGAFWRKTRGFPQMGLDVNRLADVPRAKSQAIVVFRPVRAQPDRFAEPAERLAVSSLALE